MKFLKDVIAEMKQVTWIKGKILTKMTITVISSIIILALFFGILDLGIGAVIKSLLSL